MPCISPASMAAVSIAVAACCGVGIVGVQGLHVTDNTNEFHNDIDVAGKVRPVRHNAEPSLGSAAAHQHHQDHHQHHRAPHLSDFADENTMQIQEHVFRRSGAGFAKLGAWCNMLTFYECDWQGMIGNKKKMAKLDVEEKPGFTLASTTADAQQWNIALPKLFSGSGAGHGNGAMNVKAKVVVIDDSNDILDMINRNPTLVAQMSRVKHPHVAVAVVTAEVFDSTQDMEDTYSGEVDEEGLEKAGKLAFKAAEMYGTGGVSGLTGGLAGLEEIDQDPKKGYEFPDDKMGNSGRPQALSGKSHKSSGSSAVYQAGTIIAYDLKTVIFTDNRWSSWQSPVGQIIATQLVSNTPVCEGKDGPSCWWAQKMGYVKKPYVEASSLREAQAP